MKKILFGLMLLCMVVACKKESSKKTNPGLSTHKVAFKVGFSQRSANFSANRLTTNSISTSSADTALTNNIDILYYAVYDSVGNIIHVVNQLSSDSTFGSYTDNLLSGKYTVVIAGGKTGLLLSADGPAGPGTKPPRTLANDILSYGASYPYYDWNNFDQDAFYKKLSLTVTNSNSTQNIVLDRITSQLVVNIQDAIPSNAKGMGIVLSPNTGDVFYVGSGTAQRIQNIESSSSIFNALNSTDIGTKNYQLKMLFLYVSPISVDLYCSSTSDGIGTSGTPIAQKVIANVTGQANTQTVLTGNLFGGAATGSIGGFTFTIDTAWNATPITKTFH